MALACGVAVGLVYALLYTRVGMPSFVATRRPAGAAGHATVYPRAKRQHQPAYTSPLVRFGQLLVMPGWFSHLMALLPDWRLLSLV